MTQGAQDGTKDGGLGGFRVEEDTFGKLQPSGAMGSQGGVKNKRKRGLEDKRERNEGKVSERHALMVLESSTFFGFSFGSFLAPDSFDFV